MRRNSRTGARKSGGFSRERSKQEHEGLIGWPGKRSERKRDTSVVGAHWPAIFTPTRPAPLFAPRVPPMVSRGLRRRGGMRREQVSVVDELTSTSGGGHREHL